MNYTQYLKGIEEAKSIDPIPNSQGIGRRVSDKVTPKGITPSKAQPSAYAFEYGNSGNSGVSNAAVLGTGAGTYKDYETALAAQNAGTQYMTYNGKTYTTSIPSLTVNQAGNSANLSNVALGGGATSSTKSYVPMGNGRYYDSSTGKKYAKKPDGSYQELNEGTVNVGQSGSVGGGNVGQAAQTQQGAQNLQNYAIGNALSGETNYQDIAAASLADRQNYLNAMGQYRDQWQQAGSQLRVDTQNAVQPLQGQSSTLYSQATSTLNKANPSQEVIDKLLSTSDAMASAGAKLNSNLVAQASALKASALSQYKNTSAAQVEQQRSALNTQYNNKRDAIMASAQQMGYDPSSPVVQQQIKDLDNWKMGQLGSMANQASITYNDSMATLRSSYDAMINQAGATGGALEMQGLSESAGAQRNAGELQQTYETIKNAAWKAGIDAASQLSIYAAQLEQVGNTTAAEWLKEEPIAYSPIAGIISDSFAMAQAYQPSYTVGNSLPSSVSANSPSYSYGSGGSTVQGQPRAGASQTSNGAPQTQGQGATLAGVARGTTGIQSQAVSSLRNQIGGMPGAGMTTPSASSFLQSMRTGR